MPLSLTSQQILKSGIFACLLSIVTSLAAANLASAQNLENMLNQVSGSFSNAPPGQQAPSYQSGAPYAPQYNMGGQPRPVYYPTQNWAQSAPPSYAQQGPVMQQLQAPPPSGYASPMQRLRTMYGGGGGGGAGINNGAGYAAPAANPRQSLMHIFFGDGNSSSSSSSSAANSADQAQKLETARENLSVARNQESRAENDAARANEGSDKSARRAAASEARYAARAARLAADRASSAGYSGGPAGDVAAEARGAADNAQAAADRAEANANGGGW